MENAAPLYFCNKCPKSFNHKIKLAVHTKYHHKTKHSSSDRENDVISFEFYPKDMPLWKFAKDDNNEDTELKIENPKTPVALPTKNIPGNSTAMQNAENSMKIQVTRRQNMSFDNEIKQSQQKQLEQIQTRSNSQLKKRGRDIDADNEDGPLEKSQRSGDSISLASTETITVGSNQIPLPSSLPISKNPMDPSPKRKRALKSMEQEGIQTMPKSYKCSYCAYTSAYASNVKTHERIHTGEKPFKCRYCDHSTNQLQHMKRHERTHTGERPYKCRYCDHRAIGADEITLHERIHTGERPYKCGSCEYTASLYSSLACHLMIHSGEKPYKCRYCDHRSIHSSHIKIHERIHAGTKPYKCLYCEYSATNASHIKRHERIHTGERLMQGRSRMNVPSSEITQPRKALLAEKQSDK